jgi:hypothetical protein
MVNLGPCNLTLSLWKGTVLLLLLTLLILFVSNQGPFPQNGSALVFQRENRAKWGFKKVTRMVLILLGYNYGIQSPAGSNPKFLKVYMF